MRHTIRFSISILLLLFTLTLSAAAAQDILDQQPLMQMLARVPDTAVSRSEIYFNDRRAVESAYPDAKMPANWGEFELITPDALDNPVTAALIKPLAVWWRVWMRNSSSLMLRDFRSAQDMAATVGFDFFNIDQELNYGLPPQQTLQLAGTFNLEAVRTAYTALDFAREDRSDVELWCGPDGCDSGMQVNVRNRNPANPFGGDLGRKWPMLVQDGMLIGSPDFQNIENHIDVISGAASSLAAAPEYRAAVEAVTSKGVLMQAYFLDGEPLAQMGQPANLISDPRLTPEQINALIERLFPDFEPLPAFQLLMLGDTVSDTQQAAQIALVYADAADAATAAELLPKRIEDYQSFRLNRPFKEVLADRGVLAPSVQLIDSAAGGPSVVLVTFATTKATSEQILEFTASSGPVGVTAPGMVYNLLAQSVLARDIGWLSTATREDLQALAGSSPMQTHWRP
ncbi:MAG: hypothetical protein R3E39_17055 [Anaerolineae bacterium]